MLALQNDFKTIQFTLFFTDKDVNEKSVYRFLLPRLMTIHTNLLTTRKQMSEKLEDLYGAYFRPQVERLGNLSVVSITLTFADPKIVGSQTLFLDALDLFKQVIFEHDSLSKEIFEEEKRMLLEQWETLYDKKRQYAQYQYNALLYGDDTYGYPLSGTYEDIKKLSKEKLEAYYKDVFLNNNIRFIVNGNLSTDELDQLKALGIKHEALPFPYEVSFREARDRVEKREQTVMQQGIIKMGYHFPIFRQDKLYYAACLLDDMIGGYPESRLFKEIREKLGLCYDIQSGFDPYRGVIHISSGVDAKKIDIAIDSIMFEVQKMIDEGPKEDELLHAKAYYTHQLKTSLDSQSMATKRLYLKDVLGYDESIEKRLKAIEKVSLDDIKEASAYLKLDTIYVLHGGQDDH